MALNNGVIANFSANNASFKFKQKITDETVDDSRKDVKILVPLKYFSNFWTTLEMPLINRKTNLIITRSGNCVVSNAAANQETAFAITDSKLDVSVVTLLTDDNGQLLQ